MYVLRQLFLKKTTDKEPTFTDYNITRTLISQAFRLGTRIRSFHLKQLDKRISNPRVWTLHLGTQANFIYSRRRITFVYCVLVLWRKEDGGISCWILHYAGHMWRVVIQLCFYVLLTVHLSITLVNDQLDAQLFCFTIRLLQSSICFEQRRAHHQEVKLY